jgi:hypothetical protein
MFHFEKCNPITTAFVPVFRFESPNYGREGIKGVKMRFTSGQDETVTEEMIWDRKR